MRTVGEALVEGLAARGVEVVFGIPGVHTVELYRGLAGGRIRHVTPRHEQGAGFMAATYGRLTGRAGVCMATLGPGATNFTTPAAYAHLGAFPLIMITGMSASRGSARRLRTRRSSSSWPVSKRRSRRPEWREGVTQRKSYQSARAQDLPMIEAPR